MRASEKKRNNEWKKRHQRVFCVFFGAQHTASTTNLIRIFNFVARCISRLLIFGILFYLQTRTRRRRRQRWRSTTTATKQYSSSNKHNIFFYITAEVHSKDRTIKKESKPIRTNTHTQTYNNNKKHESNGNEDMSVEISSLWRRCTCTIDAKKKHKSTW